MSGCVTGGQADRQAGRQAGRRAVWQEIRQCVWHFNYLFVTKLFLSMAVRMSYYLLS